MVEIELDVRQRVNIALICEAQDGKVGLVRVLSRIAERVELTSEERDRFEYKRLENGTAMWSRAADAAPPVKVALETEDARVLSQVLSEWPHLKTADLGWLTPVLEVLPGR